MGWVRRESLWAESWLRVEAGQGLHPAAKEAVEQGQEASRCHGGDQRSHADGAHGPAGDQLDQQGKAHAAQVQQIFAGAGALVPITGFANSVAAPAIEYQKEGQVFGIGVKITVNFLSLRSLELFIQFLYRHNKSFINFTATELGNYLFHIVLRQ